MVTDTSDSSNGDDHRHRRSDDHRRHSHDRENRRQDGNDNNDHGGERRHSHQLHRDTDLANPAHSKLLSRLEHVVSGILPGFDILDPRARRAASRHAQAHGLHESDSALEVNVDNIHSALHDKDADKLLHTFPSLSDADRKRVLDMYNTEFGGSKNSGAFYRDLGNLDAAEQAHVISALDAHRGNTNVAGWLDYQLARIKDNGTDANTQIMETLSLLNHETVSRAQRQFAAAHGGQSIEQAIDANGDVDPLVKQALPTLLEGVDRRDAPEQVKLARLAVRYQQAFNRQQQREYQTTARYGMMPSEPPQDNNDLAVDLLDIAVRGGSRSAVQARLQLSSDPSVVNAFHSDARVKDLLENGIISISTVANADHSDKKNIETAVLSTPEYERQMFAHGKRLLDNCSASNSPEDRQSVQLYQQTMAALREHGDEKDVERWENELLHPDTSARPKADPREHMTAVERIEWDRDNHVPIGQQYADISAALQADPQLRQRVKDLNIDLYNEGRSDAKTRMARNEAESSVARSAGEILFEFLTRPQTVENPWLSPLFAARQFLDTGRLPVDYQAMIGVPHDQVIEQLPQANQRERDATLPQLNDMEQAVANHVIANGRVSAPDAVLLTIATTHNYRDLESALAGMKKSDVVALSSDYAETFHRVMSDDLLQAAPQRDQQVLQDLLSPYRTDGLQDGLNNRERIQFSGEDVPAQQDAIMRALDAQSIDAQTAQALHRNIPADELERLNKQVADAIQEYKDAKASDADRIGRLVTMGLVIAGEAVAIAGTFGGASVLAPAAVTAVAGGLANEAIHKNIQGDDADSFFKNFVTGAVSTAPLGLYANAASGTTARGVARILMKDGADELKEDAQSTLESRLPEMFNRVQEQAATAGFANRAEATAALQRELTTALDGLTKEPGRASALAAQLVKSSAPLQTEAGYLANNSTFEAVRNVVKSMAKGQVVSGGISSTVAANGNPLEIPHKLLERIENNVQDPATLVYLVALSAIPEYAQASARSGPGR
jgi:hypothetical protein